MSYCKGFSPIFDNDSRLLILGSFPSVKSRQTEFYYGNPRNRFWSVLSEAFFDPLPETTEQKKQLCLRNGIALWDIVESCSIEGSMDANIRDFKTVDLQYVLGASQTEAILCNGAMAYKLTESVYDGNLPVVQLPSTSPANVRFDKTEWLKQLRLYSRRKL